MAEPITVRRELVNFKGEHRFARAQGATQEEADANLAKMIAKWEADEKVRAEEFAAAEAARQAAAPTTRQDAAPTTRASR